MAIQSNIWKPCYKLTWLCALPEDASDQHPLYGSSVEWFWNPFTICFMTSLVDIILVHLSWFSKICVKFVDRRTDEGYWIHGVYNFQFNLSPWNNQLIGAQVTYFGDCILLYGAFTYLWWAVYDQKKKSLATHMSKKIYYKHLKNLLCSNDFLYCSTV